MKCGTPIVFVLYFNFFYFFAEDRWSLSVPKEDSGPKSVRGQPKADKIGPLWLSICGGPLEVP